MAAAQTEVEIISEFSDGTYYDLVLAIRRDF